MTKKAYIGFVILLLFAFSGICAFADEFGTKGENFVLNGKPFIIRSGEMHYPRVPREYWRDRFRKAKAMGLNTITTYAFWNLHEPQKGKFDFTGNLDLVEYVKTAKEEGLYIILRPGPYICTEWDFGGIPSWLLAEKDMRVRTSDPRFLAASKAYMNEVGKRLAPFEIAKGGNILMVQVENEYGSFGDDHAYVGAIKQQIRDAGFTGTLFTADGSADYMLKNGTLPDVLSVINFGAGDGVEDEFKNLAKFRQNVPRMSGEYWVGWFDHWGEKRHTNEPEVSAQGVDWMLQNGISFNLYMFHGGTTFGYMAGANSSRREPYQPDTTSYDYDSPLDEAGRPTPKYYAIREVIKKHLPAGETLPEVPTSAATIEIPEFALTESADPFANLGKPVASEAPVSMEELGQDYGYVLYRTKLKNSLSGELKFENVRDYANILVNGKVVGTLDRRKGENTLKIDAKAGDVLDVFVENMGRVNFGKDFIFDRKGIFGKVTLNGDELANWQIYKMPFKSLQGIRFRKAAGSTDRPTLYRGHFDLNAVGDTFLATDKLGKGHVWVNGHHLGRYWNIGPQQTLYLPAGWLKRGRNEVIVLESGTPKSLKVRGMKDQIFQNL